MNKEDFKKIAYPETYADEKELHDIFTFMRNFTLNIKYHDKNIF